MPNTRNYRVRKLVKTRPSGVKRYRTKRLPGGKLLRIAVTGSAGPQGGKTVATSMMTPKKKKRGR